MDQPVKTLEMPVNRTFSLRLSTIAQLSALSYKLGMDLSKVVRDAIDEYYTRHIDEAQKVAEN